MHNLVDRPVYYVSTRPEAYEQWGEVGLEAASRLAALIAERAGRRFPDIEFRCDAEWHVHPADLTVVAAYIDAHMQDWSAGARSLQRAA